MKSNVIEINDSCMTWATVDDMVVKQFQKNFRGQTDDKVIRELKL
jgi:hypothetical protein